MHSIEHTCTSTVIEILCYIMKDIITLRNKLFVDTIFKICFQIDYCYCIVQITIIL